MFGKLLKHDFTHYLKLWLIGAATALFMSVVGGFCLSRLDELYKSDYIFLALIFTLATIVSVVCIVAFYILTTILIVMRYAKNCFSDEGYLTFTLPVKRSAVFNAKFVNAILYDLMSLAVLSLSFTAFLGIGVKNFFRDLFDTISIFYRTAISEMGVYFWLYFAMIVLLIILLQLFSRCILYYCVTFAGTKVRKNRILAGIGVYYLSSIILGVLSQLGVYAAAHIVEARAEHMSYAAVLTLMAILAVWLIGGFAALYYSQLHMLDKKLNLA